MKAHITGSGHTERRAKGRNNKPKIYFAIEVLILALTVFLISFAKIKILTVVSALVAVFVVIISCWPRYKKIEARQTEKHTYNYTEKQ
ncbi:MAG TPA: hypothetical protein EYG78_04020 [Sulfurovum sp.]|nr:hypothetical protein [Sulfurovum sp.]